MDLATAGASTFGYAAKAFSSVRGKMLYQVHFGTDYETGEYGWTTDLDKIKKQVEWQLGKLGTDYIDYGFIHCLDDQADWEAYQRNGVLDYLIGMKEQGIVRHIGASSHTPSLAMRILDTGLVDQLMFSINPAYDYQQGEYAAGSAGERMDLYRRCEAEGVGISVMKPFSGGQLLDERTSPFGRALSPWQCLQYVLDKPGVLTVVAGAGSMGELESILGFFAASPDERDYSLIASLTPVDLQGRCVYCNHCQPCPAGIDVGLANKYYDLARAGDDLAVDHYRTLHVHADACTQCGHCNSRCPFHVDQMARMREMDAWFAAR